MSTRIILAGMNAPRPLTPTEQRVLGTLMEKARTVPDTYPLSLNAVVSGCNQKTSREPVMNVSEIEAQAALDDLKALHLAIESHGSRVARWEHNLQRALAVPEQSAVLLGLLLLRGPQTAGELRLNAERWYRFADISSVEGFLHELAERAEDKGGPLVVLLPRAPGEREARWAHLLGGPVAIETRAAGAHQESAGGRFDPTSERIERLEAELAALQATVARLCAELGVSPAGPESGADHAKTAD
ncbi:MAG TPA: YceH family protein [Ottowia sp.]|nr:YceH family protein [Ottowia sp.]HMT64877.1 YceH family protein [Ottowia sp.]